MLSLVSFGTAPAEAQVTAFKQSVAEAAAKDTDIAAFYRQNDYAPLWTGRGNSFTERRRALFGALQNADMHGLPVARYRIDVLKAELGAAKTQRDLGRVEVMLSKTFLTYARDIQTGILTPSRIDPAIVRKVPYRDRQQYLQNFAKSPATRYFKALVPSSPEYTRLLKEKMTLEKTLQKGGFGPEIQTSKLEPGDTGAAVAQLRNKLVRMGYMKRSAASRYDGDIQAAVQQFQLAHGLTPDGVAGKGTIAELNVSAQKRLQSIHVALERERWTNMERGERHILVNLTDFTARIMDDNKVTFETRAVIGANPKDRVTPEFSDTMEHMVINPTWNVPRSIATKEYLPMLQRNPNAVSHLNLIDSRGRIVRRDSVDFTQFTKASFPFAIKQPPSRSNALGLVKFMFPNRHNIYLHDTPAKNLFSREVRAYSHGCIRLHKPFEFAYELLSKQEANPKGFFHSRLETGRETTVELEKHVPVHIIYRTAFTNAKGPMQYRRDIYGRDAKIWQALAQEGVALRTVGG
ncbi:L,D-transpeptidase family protein [Cognatishimia sp. SS12]|nr:L,D-transpeptidase family protein [Cognatishimia sp. SS12]MDC0737250.1 L,D-transpeptidase family protein [Cognatishimia sp. SS12]